MHITVVAATSLKIDPGQLHRYPRAPIFLHMQRMPSIDFAPRWVLVIFFLSLCEAIGLAIYFHADITDPETASMQPAYLEAQAADTMMATGSDCGVKKPMVAREDCRQKAHEIMQARKRQEQDRPIRHVESTHPHPVKNSHHG